MNSTRKREQDSRPWARYARLSKAVTGDLEKVDWQIDRLTEYAEARDLPVSDDHVYIDNNLSAWKRNVKRPDWDRMMEAVKSQGLAGILVWKVDRFTRRPADLEALIDLSEGRGLSIEGPQAGRLDLSTANGRQQARWAAMQAASESDNTSERVKARLAQLMKDGKPMGGGRPFGFEPGGIEQRPDEVALLREVATRLVAGETVVALAADMNARGWRTVRGGEWHGRNLSRMLAAHRYGGKVEHNGEIVGTMPGDPVFDAELYADVQALLTSRRRGRRPTNQYPLTGVVTCTGCGRTMNGRRDWNARSDGTKPRVYICSRTGGGCGRSILAEPVEYRVDRYMVDRLSDPDNVADLIAESQTFTDARQAKAAKVEAIRKQLVELEVKWASGETIDEAYDAAKARLTQRLGATEKELDSLPTVAVQVTRDALARWNAAEPEEKREMIRQFGVQVSIEAGSGWGRRFEPERIKIKQRRTRGSRAA